MGLLHSLYSCVPFRDNSLNWLPLCTPLTKASEGCVLTAYADKEPGGIRWTVGYGATGSGIREGTVWTQEKADANLVVRLKKHHKKMMNVVQVPLSANQQAALTDFHYNIGEGQFNTSTLLQLLNKGDYDGASKEFARWKYDDGIVKQGLITRRRRETTLFRTGSWE